ncbi:MAG: peptide deformylase [Bdellovibrionota bacterium]|nr:MAG: peptide deformylase [Bdellovibrionota bacterium]
MAVLPLVLYPDPRLKQSCSQVSSFDKHLVRLLESMAETMYASNGIGLAAPQIGVQERITVVDVSPEGTALIELINPVITASHGTTPSEEGCLSIPGFRETIERATHVSVSYQDRTGNQQTLHAEGLMAICLQHEIDHINGTLFVDHLSRLKRELFKKWFAKQQNAPSRM